jgi:glycosyltransferase involved in cell wall biosynthesis
LTGSDEKLRLVHNGVDLEEFSVEKPVRNLNGPIRLVSVARLVPHKRVADGISAVARLLKRGITAEYCVIGEGPERERLEALRRELDLEPRVRFLGFPSRTDLIAELVSSDILLHPSERESFGVAVVEGMAAGLPVVVAQSEGVQDIVEHGRIGFLYKPGDIDSLVEYIYQIAIDIAKRQAFGATARRTVEDRFSWTYHMAQMYQLWDEVLGARRTRDSAG